MNTIAAQFMPGKMSGNIFAYIRQFAAKCNKSSKCYDSSMSKGECIEESYDEIDNNTYNEFLQTPFRPRYVMNDKFHREDERLKTFESWPLDWLDKKELAMSGMFYMGERDKTKCYFCEVEIGHWEHEDEPVPEHLRWSPNCPLLKRRTTNNVPINSEALERLLPLPSYDICGINGQIEIRRNVFPEGTAAVMDLPPLPTGASGGSGTSSGPSTSTFYPEFPEYAIETVRLRSFTAWPRTMKQRPAQLAEAGFFYTGVGDRVKCFSCGGGLKDWDDCDEPWEQHALWMGKCRYLKLIKGESFIESVVNKFMKSMSNNLEEVGELPSTTVTPTSSQAAVVALVRSTGPKESQTQQTTGITQNLTAEATQQEVEQQQREKVRQQPISATCNAGSKKTSPTIPEEKLCKICYVEEYNTAFLPCGHVVACAKCASSVTKCPLCRKPFSDVMRVYFS